MTPDEIKTVLADHTAWLRNSKTGKQANLSGADLTGADLTGANLREAALRGADLREADLSWANLREADLSGANLREANPFIGLDNPGGGETNGLIASEPVFDKRVMDAQTVLGLAYAQWRESGFSDATAYGLEDAYREYAEAVAALNMEPAPVWDDATAEVQS